jgi:hypothetical protein
MAITEQVQSQLGAYIPTILAGISITAWLLIILVLGGVMAFVIVLILISRQYKYTIIKWEEVGDESNSVLVDIGKDKAMEMSFGSLGTRILYWRRTKIYTAFPEDRAILRKFYFKRNRKTGEWESFTIKGNRDEKKSAYDTLQAKMLTHNIGIRKGLKEEFVKSNWFKENAIMLVSITFIIVVGVLFWLSLDKFLSISNQLAGVVKNVAELVERVNELIDKTNKLQGTGMVQVGG